MAVVLKKKTSSKAKAKPKPVKKSTAKAKAKPVKKKSLAKPVKKSTVKAKPKAKPAKKSTAKAKSKAKPVKKSTAKAKAKAKAKPKAKPKAKAKPVKKSTAKAKAKAKPIKKKSEVKVKVPKNIITNLDDCKKVKNAKIIPYDKSKKILMKDCQNYCSRLIKKGYYYKQSKNPSLCGVMVNKDLKEFWEKGVEEFPMINIKQKYI